MLPSPSAKAATPAMALRTGKSSWRAENGPLGGRVRACTRWLPAVPATQATTASPAAVSALAGPENALVRLPDSVCAASNAGAPARRNAARMTSLPLFQVASMSPRALDTSNGLPLKVGSAAIGVDPLRTPLVRVLVLIAGLAPFSVPKYANTAAPEGVTATSGVAPNSVGFPAVTSNAEPKPFSDADHGIACARPSWRSQTTMPLPSSPTEARESTASTAAAGETRRWGLIPPAARPVASTKLGLTVRFVQVTSVSPRLLVATSGKRASSVNADRSCGTLNEPPAGRVDCSIVSLTEVPTCCSQTTIAVPRPSTATRGKPPPGAPRSSGGLNDPPGGRTLATTCDRPPAVSSTRDHGAVGARRGVEPGGPVRRARDVECRPPLAREGARRQSQQRGGGEHGAQPSDPTRGGEGGVRAHLERPVAAAPPAR